MTQVQGRSGASHWYQMEKLLSCTTPYPSFFPNMPCSQALLCLRPCCSPCPKCCFLLTWKAGCSRGYETVLASDLLYSRATTAIITCENWSELSTFCLLFCHSNWHHCFEYLIPRDMFHTNMDNKDPIDMYPDSHRSVHIWLHLTESLYKCHYLAIFFLISVRLKHSRRQSRCPRSPNPYPRARWTQDTYLVGSRSHIWGFLPW